MAEYIAAQKPDVFVMDYDYNAPTPAHLEKTHEPFFKIIRNASPILPIIIISKPDRKTRDGDFGSYEQRRDILKATYDKAIFNGDKQVFFIDGGNIMDGFDPSACTMDGAHPNDLGFFRMASVIGEKVRQSLEMLN